LTSRQTVGRSHCEENVIRLNKFVEQDIVLVSKIDHRIRRARNRWGGSIAYRHQISAVFSRSIPAAPLKFIFRTVK